MSLYVPGVFVAIWMLYFCSFVLRFTLDRDFGLSYQDPVRKVIVYRLEEGPINHKTEKVCICSSSTVETKLFPTWIKINNSYLG